MQLNARTSGRIDFVGFNQTIDTVTNRSIVRADLMIRERRYSMPFRLGIASDSIPETAHSLEWPHSISDHQMNLRLNANHRRFARAAFGTWRKRMFDFPFELLTVFRTFWVRAECKLPLLDGSFIWDNNSASVRIKGNWFDHTDLWIGGVCTTFCIRRHRPK